MVEKYYLCVFKSSNNALFIFNLLQEEGKNSFQLMATPCALRVGCGYSIRFFNKSYMDLILKKIKEHNIPLPQFYHANKINGNMKYKEL